MKISEIHWHSYRLPMLNSFTTAHGATTAREGIIVQVTTEHGISGIGEIAPLPAFGGESLADACSLLPALAARLQDKTVDEALNLILAGEKQAQRSPLPLHSVDLKWRCSMRLAKLRDVESVRYSLQLVPYHEQKCRSTPLSVLLLRALRLRLHGRPGKMAFVV